MLADKGCSTHAIREHRRGAVSPPDPRTQRSAGPPSSPGSAGGRPPTFDPTAFRRRNVVERCFNRLEQYRAIATRYDKTAIAYRGMLDLVA